ncbi:phosphoribosylglycinamide formyltransferase [Candidatus Margulisiibacteriota bacterium]
MKKLGVLISGRGSNLQAIIDACARGEIPAKVEVVISNKPDAYGLERAKKHNIDTRVVSDEKGIVKVLNEKKADLVCLAGYMRIVGKTILEAYKNKIINIHPALLPSFPGLHGQKQAIDYGVKVSGVTVHFVDEGCDTGPIILQRTVEVKDDDTEEILSARILEQEHKAYPAAIKLFCEDKLKIKGRRVIIS